MKYQKLLFMNTYRNSIRADVDGWDTESGKTAAEHLEERITDTRNKNQVPVGLIGHPKGFYGYATPLHALADGWRLMAPPTKHVTDERECFEWLFEKITDGEID